MWIQTTKLKNIVDHHNRLISKKINFLLISKTKLFVFSSVPNIFGLALIEQIFTDLINPTKFTMLENEDF